jgi:uracil-DNA glycosylase
VDVRAQLRQYLEQRRDAGDQELVLDSMSVDEVMRLLGALKNRPVETVVPIPVTPRQSAPPPPALAVPVASAPAPPLPIVASGEPIVVGSARAELFGGGPHAALATLDDVAAAATACTRCSLYQTATHCVPGEGSPQAKLVCVGEAPGETEDQTGRPFVGKAGQLLTKILAAIDVKREDAFIVNVLKHRPPGNRNPLPDEVAACSPFLVRQIELLRPKVILALGTFAAQTLLETKLSIGKLRGTIHRYYGVPLIVTYHPAALLRNPGWKRPAWEDVQQARRLLDADAPDGA